VTAIALRLGGTVRRPSQTLVAGALLGLALVGAAAAWLVLIAPQHSRAGDLDAQIQRAQTEIAAARSATPTATAGKVDAKALELAMPDSPDIPRVLDELSANAAAAGVSLVSITPQPEAGATGSYRTIPLTVVVQGKFFGVESFLRRLRTRVDVHGSSVDARGRLYDVTNVSLQQTEPAPSILANLSVQVFAFSGAAATSPAAPAPTSTTTTAGTGG
jgi:Tfp pilus assembly protein PilO